jgi:hypothetical protein
MAARVRNKTTSCAASGTQRYLQDGAAPHGYSQMAQVVPTASYICPRVDLFIFIRFIRRLVLLEIFFEFLLSMFIFR